MIVAMRGNTRMDLRRHQQGVPVKVTLILAFVFVFMSKLTFECFRSVTIYRAELSVPASLLLTTSHFFRSDLYSHLLTVTAIVMFVKRKKILATFYAYSPSRKRIALYGTSGFMFACLLAVMFSAFYTLPSVLFHVLTSSSYHTWINHYSHLSESLYVKFLYFITWYVPWFLPLLGITAACVVDTVESEFLFDNV